MITFNLNIDQLFSQLNGLNNFSKFLFIKRFEFGHYKYKKDKNLKNLSTQQKKVINMYLSQITSVNNSIHELLKYNSIRIYLTKTFRGRAQALGKPSKGQRT
jgi:ribosomal protein S13